MKNPGYNTHSMVRRLHHREEMKEPRAIWGRCPSNFSLIGKLLLIDRHFVVPDSYAPIMTAVRPVEHTLGSFAVWWHIDSHYWHFSNVNYLQHNIISLKGLSHRLAASHQRPVGWEGCYERDGLNVSIICFSCWELSLRLCTTDSGH